MSLELKASALNQSLALIIQAAGAHRFAYTKVSQETGEAVWRWPNEPTPSRQLVEALGQVVDVTA